MSPKISRLALILAMLTLVTATGAWADPPLDKPHVPDEIIIKFAANATQHDKDLVLSDLGAIHIKHFKRIKSDLKRVGSCSVVEAIGRYKNHPKVEFIEPNYVVTANELPNDARFDELWGLHNTGQTGGTAGADISASMAWDVFTGNPNIVVGVIDTGVDYNHQDLAANIWVNPGEIPGNGVDDDSNGYIDDIHGWDFVNNDSDPMDDNGHGTHCSGTIGASANNSVGVAGINWQVRIMGLKFLDASGSGSTSGAVDAIEYATMMAQRYPGTIRLTSNSWGGGGFSEALRQAIEDAGNADMLFIAAAGNSSSNTDVSPHYPSSYDLDNIIAVAATDHNDELASFSSYGVTTVDLAAPGVDILSTVPGNGYGLSSGTSMATPHVSGVAALTFGRFPAVSALDAKSLILLGADPLANLDGVVLSGARLNAFWPIAEPDSIVPAPVVDLAVTEAGSNWLDVAWTATGDDGNDGTASRYDMRYSTTQITELNWDSANLAAGEPDPGPPGTPESMRVSGLDFNSTYYVAVKVLDEFGNASDLSNLASSTTLGAPDIATSPTSLSDALLTGGASAHTLTLSNVGQGTLDFEIPTPTLLGETVNVNAYVDFPKGGTDYRPGQPALEATGGPDSFGYRWADSNDPFGPTFAWVDISGVGNTALSSGDDVSAGPFAIGFEFPFYGADFTEFNVCSNGFLSLTSSSTDYSNQPLPSLGAPPHMIAPFWDDLNVVSGAIYYYYDGSRLIVQWDAVDHYDAGGPYTFQAILYPDGTIEYQYLDIGAPDNSATVGWQNGAGTDGLSVVFNDSYVASGLAVQIHAVPQWLTVAPVAGTVYAPGSTTLDVGLDATGLLGGTYDGIIRILSNDPDEPEYEVPVQLVVTGAPDIAVEPISYDFGQLFLGAIGGTDILVRNVGTDLLTVTGITIGNGAFVADVSSFTVAPRTSQLVHVTFTPTVALPYNTTMTVTSDDPDTPSAVVSLAGEGLEPPQFAVNPTSLTSNLLTGETDMQALTLTNDGGSDFVFDLNVDFHAAVTVYEGVDLDKNEIDTRVGTPVALGQGGPDLFGYRWIDSDEPGGPTFDWVDISATGTPVFSSTGDDQNTGPLPVGFSFPFYGNDFAEFRVCSNGWISFTSTSTDLSNDPLPSSGAPENILALFWDDLIVRPSSGANVYYEYDGSRLIVQYDNVDRYSSGGPYTMQALLYPSGTIVYQYLSMQGTRLDEATIGIQNATRDDGLTVAFNAAYMHDNLAVRLEAFPEWLTVSPTSGVVPPGEFVDVTANLNASGLFGGAYTADIIINSNDPSVPTLAVPVTMNVTGAPQIQVSATAIDFGAQFVGYPTLRNLVISNAGTDNLIISGASFTAPEFVSNLTTPVSLGPTQSLLIDLNFVPSSATTFNGTLTLVSNDPNQGSLVIDLAGAGLIPPVASVSPTSLASALFTGESDIQMVTLFNTGGSDLEFAVASELTLDQVVVHGSPELAKDEVDTRPGILGSGGPDNFGYSWSDSDEPGGPTFSWVDISATGTPVFSSTSDDRNTGPFPVGFSFPFYGNDFTEFRVCSNGWISFTSSSTDLSNDPLPAAGAPENLLALFWDDLIVTPSAGANVYYEYDGSRLIVQYDNVSRYSSGGPYTMQVILQPNGSILYQYLSMSGTRLNEATIGIQNDLRDDGLTVVYNADYMHDNLAVRLSTVPDWLSTNPTEGIIPVGGSLDIAVTFDAAGLFGGAYDGAVRIGTNDPSHGLISVPAHLDVTGIPMIALDPVTLDFGSVYLSLSNTLPLTVSNPGTQTLEVSAISSDDPEITVDLAVFSVEPLQSRVINVTFSAATSGTHDAVLSITHNADGSPADVAMSAVGVVPPEVAWSPSSLEGAAMPGGQKIKTLEICNDGGSDLVFDLGASENTGLSVLQYDSGGELPKETEDPRPGILGSGGPDAYGYTWVDSDDPIGPAFDWVDISTVGTPVFGAYSDDGNRGAFPIGFDFPFYGEAFNEFRVCSNGWLSFTSTLSTYTNQPLPNSSSTVPENLLAVYWDDMVVDPSDGNEIYYYNDGTRLIVQYEIRRIAQGSPPYYSFQAILYPDGNIVYQYASLGTSQNSATIGIQNGAKDDGLTAVFNDTYVHEGLAILFSTGSSWLSASPESGVVAPGECVEIQVLMNAADLEAGDHLGNIHIASNDITDSFVEVPVMFHVGTVDAVDTDVDPNTLNVASNGKFMTVYVELPAPYDPADVLVETVLLNGVVPAELRPFSNDDDFNGNGVPDLMIKFSRSAIAGILPEGDSVELVVTGEIEDTIYFVAVDTIRMINPTVMSPNGGDTYVAGSTLVINWQNPDGWNVHHTDLFWTPDDGETWFDIAREVANTTYEWALPTDVTEQARIRVLVFDNAGMLGFDTSDEVFQLTAQVTGITPSKIPSVHALAQNAPNPFNPRTEIQYDLPRDEQVNISIYDVKGRLVKVLVSEPRPAGTYRVTWDGVDNRGRRVASGVYFYRIVAGEFQASRRMLLMK